LIDTLRPVSLPEGVEITLRLAGPVTRARAWFLDFVLRVLLASSLPGIFQVFGKAGFGLAMVASFAIWVLYPIVLEAIWGATPGKRLCNLVVVMADGTPLTWPASALRNVMRFADMLPIGYAVGLASMMMDSQFRRLGDLAAGTLVVHRETATAAGQAPAGPALAAPVALTPLEQRAVLDYAERRRSWSDERAAELAEVAAPLVEDLRGVAASARIAGIAAGLVQRR
jgi:uncharacterized RDD family membrane protein YckC